MDQQKFGVVLIDNLDADLSDSEIYQFFSRVANVTSVLIPHLENHNSATRYCWVNVENTIETVETLNTLSIRNGAKKINARLMGYLNLASS